MRDRIDPIDCERDMTNEKTTAPSGVPARADLTSPSEAAATDAGHSVGYGRPPKHSRFRPGQSGNPRGRPRGAKSVPDIVRKILAQKVTITENGRTRRVPRLEAILLRAAGEASRGEPRALRLLLQLGDRYAEVAPAEAERETMASDLAILRRYLPDFDKPAPASIGNKHDQNAGDEA